MQRQSISVLHLCWAAPLSVVTLWSGLIFLSHLCPLPLSPQVLSLTLPTDPGTWERSGKRQSGQVAFCTLPQVQSTPPAPGPPLRLGFEMHLRQYSRNSPYQGHQ